MKNRAKILFILLAIIPLIAGSLVVATIAPSSSVAFAAGEGEGTAAIIPLTVTAGSTGNTLTISYTAGTTAWSTGQLQIAIPTSWSSPSTTQTALGYVKASTGTVAVLGSVATVSGITMDAGTIMYVCYGDTTDGGPGATAQATAGTATFVVKSDPDGSGPLTEITSSPTVTVEPAHEPRLVITGDSTMTAGDPNTLTITAQDADGDKDLSYDGDKALTFFGLGAVGAHVPTVTNKDGAEVNIGMPTTITFAMGEATADLIAYKAETTTLDVTDGTINSYGSPLYDLDLTVNPGPLDHYTVTSTKYVHTVDVPFTVTVTARDEWGNVVTTDSTTEVRMTSNSTTMEFDSNGDGTFRAVGDDLKTLTEGTFDIPAKDSFMGSNITITATDALFKTGDCLPNTYTILPPEEDGNGDGGNGGDEDEDEPTIALSPSSVFFTATEGGENPSSRTLSIWNSGAETLTWSLTGSADWLTVTPTSGSSTGVADKDSVTLSVDISQMSADTYRATLTITASGATNSPQAVIVTLTIGAPPTPTDTVGTAESWVETEDGKIILHFRAGSFATDTSMSIKPKTIYGEAPEDFSLGETCFSIEAEAELLRAVDVCVRYTDADVNAANGDPGKLRLAVYDETEAKWDVLSTKIYKRARTACARVDHLSDFAILAGPGPPGFFSADWWTDWRHITPFAAGVVIVIAIAVWLWLRYRYYY